MKSVNCHSDFRECFEYSEKFFIKSKYILKSNGEIEDQTKSLSKNYGRNKVTNIFGISLTVCLINKKARTFCWTCSLITSKKFEEI